jgi:hypothetical protein
LVRVQPGESVRKARKRGSFVVYKGNMTQALHTLSHTAGPDWIAQPTALPT